MSSFLHTGNLQYRGHPIVPTHVFGISGMSTLFTQQSIKTRAHLRDWSTSKRNLLISRPAPRIIHRSNTELSSSSYAKFIPAGSRGCFTWTPTRRRRVSSRTGLVPWKGGNFIKDRRLWSCLRFSTKGTRPNTQTITLYMKAYCSFVWTAPARSLLMV